MGPQLISAFLLFLGYLSPVNSIFCYQCNSTDTDDPYQCSEFLGKDIDIQPKSCDEVYGAAYCIKHTGRFEAECIFCYQCAPNNTDCSDLMIHDKDGTTVHPKSCDHVFEASYCIKHTGGFGTRRYCSSLDLGNYCETVKHAGDQREYRTCKYTCSSDGCNSSSTFVGNILTVLLSSFYLIFK